MKKKFLHYKTLVLAPTVAALLLAGGCGKDTVARILEVVNVSGIATISGTPAVGETLTGTVSDANGTSGSTFVYQWLRSGATIAGATSSTYTTVLADLGSTISVNASFTDEEGFAENVTSASTDAITAVNDVGVVTVTGKSEPGETLTATVTDGNGLAMSAITYQWQAGTTDINGATSSTYDIPANQAPTAFRVIVSYTDDFGFAENLTSASTSVLPVVANPAFIDFTGNSSDPNWAVTEGGALGQVQTTSNNASDDATAGNGSLKFRLNDNDEKGGMGATQLLPLVTPNTDYVLTSYVLHKTDVTATTATIGFYAGATTTVVASKTLDYHALEAAGAEESEEDDFLKDTFAFNSGDNTSLTLFVIYDANKGVYDSGGVRADTELWVDDITIAFPE